MSDSLNRYIVNRRREAEPQIAPDSTDTKITKRTHSSLRFLRSLLFNRKITKRTQLPKGRRKGGGGERGVVQVKQAIFTKRTHFAIRVLGVYSWFNLEIYQAKPCAQSAGSKFRVQRTNS